MFYAHFASCFSKSHPSPDFIHTSPTSSIPCLSSISCTSEEVTHLITSLKTKNTSGPDGRLKGSKNSLLDWQPSCSASVNSTQAAEASPVPLHFIRLLNHSAI